MEFYHMVHSVSAIIMIVASFGHIFMGTAALEGTFEVMKTGYCDTNWAKDHHDLWYDKVKQSAETTATESQQQSTESTEKVAT
jgi:formate dehydrogenase subunit gamma